MCTVTHNVPPTQTHAHTSMSTYACPHTHIPWSSPVRPEAWAAAKLPDDEPLPPPPSHTCVPYGRWTGKNYPPCQPHGDWTWMHRSEKVWEHETFPIGRGCRPGRYCHVCSGERTLGGMRTVWSFAAGVYGFQMAIPHEMKPKKCKYRNFKLLSFS